MRLTSAKPGDAPWLAAILSDWIDEMPWMPKIHTPDEDARFLRWLIGRCDVLVLRGWRGPQGFMARDGAVIHGLYLRPGARGRGWGHRMLDAAKAASPRLELWAFQANTRALRFYTREGFVEAERTDGAGNDEKLPDLRMVWEHS